MSLDVPEPQVLVSTGEHAWDRWVLSRRQPGALWLALGSGLEVEVLDVKDHRIIALTSAQKFSIEPEDEVRTFDDAQSEHDMRDAHSRAARMASLLGFPTRRPAGVSGGSAPRRKEGWRICHPGSKLLGDELPDDVVTNPSTGVDKARLAWRLSRASVGIVDVGSKRRNRP